MVHIVVATHGGLAGGILSTLALVTGDVDEISALALLEGDDPSAFELQMRGVIEKLNALPGSEGTLVLVDLLGGTPSTCAARIISDEGSARIRCLTGLNFPMLVEAVFNRERKSLVELEASCAQAARAGIIQLADLVPEHSP
ncbi:PTS system fructose subfamily IIA component [Coriobacterium glomerans PW2]|uniref:PTS system fructose subfamily IIA component n=1 Tax=Coriobacterium glomerans (strain ATCC 49209 / DSM 20642 / JCM 10262 / PW2) TaxID=700015 RepID=F2N8F3_CORGP|nr:PTS sugar transporter subunit IIA [Coriobacterium glomerans]AEB07336.1 PTS system fructose subfamily IIA component [Coriobacterium glomerans PW2]